MVDQSIKFALAKKNYGKQSSWAMRNEAELRYNGPIPQETLDAIEARRIEETSERKGS